MMVAVFSNARTTVSAKKEGEDGWREAFNTAFRAGGVMGFSLCALSLMILYLLCLIYRHVLQIDGTTPLLMASQQGHAAVVNALLMSRANVDQADVSPRGPHGTNDCLLCRFSTSTP